MKLSVLAPLAALAVIAAPAMAATPAKGAPKAAPVKVVKKTATRTVKTN